MAKYRSGQSGNPKGRPKGSRDRRTALRALLEPHAPELVQRVVDAARRGNMRALRLCIDRLMPPLRARDVPIRFKLSSSIAEQAKDIVEALAEGEVTPTEAAMVMHVLSDMAKIFETQELAKRIAELEKGLKEWETYAAK